MPEGNYRVAEIPEHLIANIRFVSRYGVWYGNEADAGAQQYFNMCRHYHRHTGTFLIFTRDTGHHSSGWMKNPEFERCLHLSLSFRPKATVYDEGLLTSGNWVNLLRNSDLGEPEPFAIARAKPWIDALFHPDANLAWHEPSFSDMGKARDVHHFRLFCDAGWNAIKPRGEVYSTELTKRGWKSWSEVQGEDALANWVSAE